jgi:hypothetical protein
MLLSSDAECIDVDRGSARRLAPIHPDDLAGDVGRFARRDEDDRVGDLCRRSAAFQGNGCVESRLLLG